MAHSRRRWSCHRGATGYINVVGCFTWNRVEVSWGRIQSVKGCTCGFHGGYMLKFKGCMVDGFNGGVQLEV